MSNKSKYLMFLGGAAVGAGIALLFAPKPGKETREDVKRKLGELGEQGKELLAKSKQVFQQQKTQISAAITAGKKAYNDSAVPLKQTVVNGHKREKIPAGV